MSGIIQALIGSLKAAAGGDPNWASVTMLLPGNGTNGAQNNTFIDSSTNAFTVTRNGNTTQGTFSPFTAAAPYAAATKGGSGYFDGTGDAVKAANNAAFSFGTGDLTLEAWVYLTAYPAVFGTIIGQPQTNVTAGNTVAIGMNSSGAAQFYAAQSTGAYVVSLTAGIIPLNTWTHITGVRNGSAWNLYVNGTSGANTTQSPTLTQDAGAGGIEVGGSPYFANYYVNGYISNARVVKGTAVYTANFTPSTTPLTAITNTSLLLNFTNAGIIDNAMLNDLETVGNAQISTAQSKFGGSSIAFDGTGDWLVSPDAIAQQLDTGNFTIEGWLRLNATGVAYGVVSKGTSTTGWSVNVTSGDKLQFSYTATQLTGASSLAINTWYHFAVVRNGSAAGNLVIYLNGVADATSAGAVNDNFNQTSVQYVGASRTGADSLNGYIDDLRITKGVARYTANFTPPAAAFPTS